MNGYIVQHLSNDGDWVDFQGFNELAEAEVFVAAQNDPTEWKIIECNEAR